MPIVIEGLSPVYVDLRDSHSHYLLSGSPYRSSPYEQEEQATFRAIVKAGDTVFDIGANLGFHLVLLSHLVGPRGKVFAFEPNPLLRRNLALTVSHLSNTTLYPCALSDEKGEMTFFISEDHMKSSLGEWLKDSEITQQVKCQTRCMDELVDAGELPVPDFIKCDVEGAELKVFTGAQKTLNRTDAPVILFEANIYTVKGFGTRVTAAADFLTGLKHASYKLFEQVEGGYKPLTYTDQVHANILAVPESQLQEHAAVTGSGR